MMREPIRFADLKTNEKRDQIYNFFCELIKEANQIRGIEADGEDTSNQLC